MLAAVFEGEGKLVVKDVKEPELADLELKKKYKEDTFFVSKGDLVKIRVLAASICGTDIHILEVPPKHPATKGVILGHEYVGEVVEVGRGVWRFKPGDHVVVNPNIYCGKCYYCRNAMANLCRDMTTLGIFCDGGFAEYNIAPSKQVLRIPKEMPLDQAIFFEPVSCVLHGWHALSPSPGDTILIFGAGPMGCYFTKLALLSGARRVIVAEPSLERREIVKKFGAIVTEPENLENVVKSETRRGADIAIDACGVPEVINQAIELVRPGGKISTFGEQNIRAFGNHVSFTEVTNKELKIIGSFAAVLSLDQTVTVLKEMNLSELITHRISLEEIHTGIELMRKGKGIKIIVYPTKR
jgi:2-desacetyl-2-hydroxyethyl bacteriochlorophyllide A dehydrogenase